ncbi:PRELI domain-containing protein 1, mitochondrial-like [Clytia hemisphaerica]|uniref:PRELI/MSF1 domain-containing protein n=1 Tax=Clytia hemisphaerica TaxID=252671 RepID=A0A7M5WZ24_9CNID|eukprot:TCONS_00000559-protein
MKYHTCSTNVKFRWDQVGNAIFQRYPNPWSKHVLTEDVISRKLEGPILKTVRLISKTNKLPKLANKFVSNSSGYVVEESHVNAKEKTAVTYTRNLTFPHIMVCEEKCTFSISQESKNWTMLKRESWISSSLYGFSKAAEMFGMERYKKNIKKSLKGLNYVLSKMYVPEKIPTTIGMTLPQPIPQATCSSS